MSESLSVAIVGAGRMAREHIRAFRDLPGVSVVGIQSRTRERAEALGKEFDVPLVCGSIAELHERTSAQLVVVTVPELATNAVCRSCFEHPWTVLVEKPAGYDVADAEAIAAAADERGRRAYVALNRRFYGSTRAVIAGLSPNGGPRFIKIQDQEDTVAATAGGQPDLVVQNWMYANSIHLIDLFTVLGRGRITEVHPTVPWDADDPRYVVATLTYDSGDIGLYEAVWNAPAPWMVSVTTSEKRWEMRPVEKASFQLAGSRTLQPVDDDPADKSYKAGFRLQAEQAVAAALGRPSSLPTLRDGLRSMYLTRALYSSEATRF